MINHNIVSKGEVPFSYPSGVNECLARVRQIQTGEERERWLAGDPILKTEMEGLFFRLEALGCESANAPCPECRDSIESTLPHGGKY